MHSRFIQTIAIALTLTFGLSSLADTIKVKGITYPDARVINIKGGKLFVLLAGRERQFDIELVEELTIEKYPKLEDADRQIKRKNYEEAVQLLEELAGSIREEHLQFWVNAKLVFTLDQLGQYQRALDVYQKVIDYDQGLLVKQIQPSNLPESKEAKEEALKALKRHHENTRKRDAKDILAGMVKKLEASIAGKEMKDDKANDTPNVGGALTGSGKVEQVDPVQKLIEAKNYKEASELIEKELKKDRAPLIKLLMQRAVVQANTDKPKDAALSYMRVVVHFPRAQEVNECLVGAGDMMLKLNAPDQARKLWTEAQGRVPANDKLAEEIRQRLSSLKK